MRETILTSSVLIAALLVLRGVFRNSTSRRFQYALWGLVLLRLLVPVSLPAARFSVLTAARPVRQAVQTRLEEHRQAAPTVREPQAPQNAAPDLDTHGAAPDLDAHSAVPELDTHSSAPAPAQGAASAVQAEGVHEAASPGQGRGVDPAQALRAVWLAGSAVVGGFFLVSNLRFRRRLRKYRTPYAVEGCGRPVYLTGEGVLPSPCLSGLLRPAVYLTPAALSSQETLRHVLAHEQAHARRLDPLWALLRCVCLAVYWFNPLVWAAAFAAKTDCELACDESVLARLDGDDRIAYGRALLAVACVRTGPSNPLLTATTMAGGKRQLRDRLGRIARRPQRLVAGTLAAALLAGALAACTFTGQAESPAAGNPSDSPAAPTGEVESPESAGGPAALTGEELRWFNESFFNSGGAGPDREIYVTYGDGSVDYYNIHNQFANPINLYDSPKEINLSEILYCSGYFSGEEELEEVLGGLGDCAGFKLTTDEINGILTENAGITLDEAGRDSLRFTYSEKYDAYYWMHGDTNYPGELFFSCGTRESAGGKELIRLYHNSGFSGAGNQWYCVTLSEQEDGSYWFVSNQECGKTAIPPARPEGEPLAAISLSDAKAHTPPAVATEPRPADDFGGNYEDRFANWALGGRNVQIYRATDGKIYAVTQQSDGSWSAFLSDITGHCQLVPFNGLFGHKGFYIEYYALGTGNVYDFFYFDDSDAPVRLVQCPSGTPAAVLMLDLNGDGEAELLCGEHLYFQRGGEICEADLAELLSAAYPELGRMRDCSWDIYGRFCTAGGMTEDGRQWSRQLFFDGNDILVY